MSLLASLSTRGKITLAACALAFLVAAALLIRMASAPSYATIMAGVDPQQTQKVTAALGEQGIAYELQNGGTAIAVEKSKADQARIALAGKGLNSGVTQQPGYDLLDKQKLGASNFQQQIAYQRALEGQIAQTVGQINGVQGAQVRLTLPKDDMFADEKRGATAAVLLGGDSASLEPGAVRGIANLVSSSVPELKPAAVTITDSAGQMMWPTGDGTGAMDGAGGTAASKPAAEARYNGQLATKLDALLTQTLGPGKAHVQVSSDLNVDKASEEKLTYERRGVALEEEVETEEMQGTAGAAGAAGTRANTPQNTNAAAGGAAGGSNYTRDKTTRRMGVGKTVTRREIAGGAIQRQSVAVIVDKNIKPAPDLPALTKSIEAAAGIDAARGDVVEVTSVPFAKIAEPKAPSTGLPIPPAFSGILKGLGIGIAALLFLFFVTRHLRRREAEALLDEPSWLKQLEAARPAAAMAPPVLAIPEQPTVAMPAIANDDPRRQQLDDMISREPERVAAHLRTWITEDNK
jgi:flagellar M-ring protein FliF